MLKRIPLFCQESGYSEKAVARKIEDGVWVEGREYVRAPDGRLLIDMDGFEKWALGDKRWAEKQKAAGSNPESAASESGSRSRGAASAISDAFTSPELTKPNERMKCSS